MRVELVAMLLAGCYSPSAEEGVPCSVTLECPGEQLCDTSREPPVCVDQLGDAGVGDPDAAPACVDSTQCPAEQPVCDNNACRGCVADVECASDACHELTGACIADGEVIFMAPTGGGTNCTHGQPCSLFGNALNRVTSTRRFIKLADGRYTNQLKLDGNGMSIIISGADRAAAGATLTVGAGRIVEGNSGSIALVEGVTFDGATDSSIVSRGDLTLVRIAVTNSRGPGLDLRSGTLHVAGSTVTGGTSVGIVGAGGTLDVASTVVTGNTGGGVDLQSSPATIVNSVIANNGSSNASFGGVRISTGAVTFRFNTVARNVTGLGLAGGVSCSTPQPTLLEDSIFADNGSSAQIGVLCSARFSLFSPTGPSSGSDNLVGAPMFDDPMTGFHLTAGSPAIDAADPAATEPTDLDGDARPIGTARDIGADESR